MHLKLILVILSLGHWHPADYRVCAVGVSDGEAAVLCSPALSLKAASFASSVIHGYLPESDPWIQAKKAAIPELKRVEDVTPTKKGEKI